MGVLNIIRQAEELLCAWRSHLECCVWAGALYFKRDVDQLGIIQRIVMRKLKNITYEGRLKELRLFRIKTGLREDTTSKRKEINSSLYWLWIGQEKGCSRKLQMDVALAFWLGGVVGWICRRWSEQWGKWEINSSDCPSPVQSTPVKVTCSTQNGEGAWGWKEWWQSGQLWGETKCLFGQFASVAFLNRIREYTM